MGTVGMGKVSLLLILVNNLGTAKSTALCEATEQGKYVTCKYIF